MLLLVLRRWGCLQRPEKVSKNQGQPPADSQQGNGDISPTNKGNWILLMTEMNLEADFSQSLPGGEPSWSTQLDFLAL